MSIEAIVILAILASAAIIYFISQAKRKASRSDIDIPPAPQRAGLLFGAYGWWMQSQLDQTEGWVNLHWEMFRNGVDEAIRAMTFMGCEALIDLDGQLLTPRDDKDGNPQQRFLQPDAEANVRALLDKLRAGGVLAQVRRLAPCDEPNIRNDGVNDLLPTIVPMVRRVAADYPELAGVRMFSTFTSINPIEHVDLFDDVAVDEYSAKSSILGPDGAVTKLLKRLRPDQGVFLLPGASYGQDLEPFLNFANRTPQVKGIVYYLHEVNPAESNERSLSSQPELLAQYRAAGEAIVGAGAV